MSVFYDPYMYGNYSRGPNRRDWAEKSQAALDRERQAKEIFRNKFLPQAKQATSFPFTVTGLIEPDLHLTSPCWRDFKKEVVKHGCTTKRRVVTPTEIAYMHKSKVRKGKMYWIDVTIASHPDRIIQDMKEKKERAEDAKRKKEEKAKKLAEERRLKMEEEKKKEAAIKLLVDTEYEEVVKIIHGDTSPVNKKRSLQDTEPSTGPEQSKEEDALHSPVKRLKASASTTISITAPIPRLLRKADSKHSESVSQIKEQIRKEKRDEEKKILDTLHQKMKVEEEKRIKEAEDYRDAIKNAIQGKPTSTVVQAKVLAAEADSSTKVDVASIPQ